jgi:hypothetical protein
MYEMKMTREFNGNLSQALQRLKSEKQRKFVLEFGLDYDAKRAFKLVYKNSNVAVGVRKLLENPLVKRCVDIIEKRDVARYQVEKEAVVSKLCDLLHADVREYFNANGSLKPPKELNAREAARVNSFKTKTYFNEDGNVDYVETDYKLARIETIMDMCMKHKGLFAPEQHEHVVTVDFSKLPVQAQGYDPVQARIDEASIVDSTCERVSESDVSANESS